MLTNIITSVLRRRRKVTSTRGQSGVPMEADWSDVTILRVSVSAKFHGLNDLKTEEMCLPQFWRLKV